MVILAVPYGAIDDAVSELGEGINGKTLVDASGSTLSMPDHCRMRACSSRWATSTFSWATRWGLERPSVSSSFTRSSHYIIAPALAADTRLRSGFMRRRRTALRTASAVELMARETARWNLESRSSTTTLGNPLRTTLMLHT